jgi:endogenous inhibitor of DNA gyrase (YacG/DUF329 family)
MEEKMFSRSCPICNITFQTNYNLQKYCSKECSKIARKRLSKISHKKYIQKYLKERQIYMKQYRKEHKEIISKQQKLWARKHLNERRIRDRINLKNNFRFKMKLYLNHRIYMALKGKWKSIHTEELLGCSVEFLKHWLAMQFLPNMNWKNWGKGSEKWNIDHILPCSSFDLSKESEQRKCFNFINLQPLWETDNKKKYNKILKEGRTQI